MKLVIYYVCGLALAWLGLASILTGLAYWESAAGTLLPVVVGTLMLLVALRFLRGLVRLYLPPDRGERELED